jgi:uncharacterized protein (TIGR00661 family)
MKFAFIIQGEGRGHQTQALALSQMLISNGHQVVVALVGTLNPEEVPILLKEQASFEIKTFQSPTLVYDSKTKSLSIKKTLLESLPNFRAYFKSIRFINQTIRQYQPDLIINFYDFLGGIYAALHPNRPKVICIGHQYLLLNKHFEHPKKHWMERQIVNLNTHITSLGASKKLALSFSDFPNDIEIISVPPLLRNELIEYSVANFGYILVYLTQPDLIEAIISYAENHPKILFEVFLHKKIENLPSNVRLNPISSTVFLQKMSKCRGIISTAGFESVCEAMYLNKPAMLVPIRKHYEQHCNAMDAQRAGGGLFSETINVDLFLEYLENAPQKNHQEWIHRAEEIFLREIVPFSKKRSARERVTATYALL